MAPVTHAQQHTRSTEGCEETEAALLRQEGVARAAVVTRADGTAGERRLVAYVVPEVPDADVSRHVGMWRAVYDEMYRDTVPGAAGITDDFTGWNSSYTREPIPLPQMRAWRAAAVARVRGLEPRRVLEIGVGSGLLLGPLAGRTEEYWGTDFSEAVIARLGAQVATDPRLADRVTLRCQAADSEEGLPAGHFDTVVLNSVVQYFPDAAYLSRVLDGALRRLSPGGRVLVGDVRNHGTAEEFLTAVHHAQRPGDEPPAVRAAVARARRRETELHLDPGFFTEWAAARPGVVAVDIRLKSGAAANELTRHRYEVVLHKGPARPVSLAELPTVTWGSDVHQLSALAAGLTRYRGGLRLTRVPNARLVTEAAECGVPGTARQTPLDPHALQSWGAEHGRRVLCTWSAEAPGWFEAVIVPDDGTRCYDGLYRPGDTRSTPLANVPAASRRASKLPALLRRELAAELPGHLVPDEVVLLARMPLAPGGETDRAALPAPGRADGRTLG